MKRSRALPALGFGLAGMALIADQIVKSWAHAHVAANGVLQPLPGLNVVAGSNTGVAFGLAQGAAPWFLVTVGVAISAWLALWLIRTRRRIHAIGLGLVIGGALSNVLDRLRLGAVRDFIDVYWRDYHWPAFNLADAAIVTGLAMVILFNEEPARRQKRSTNRPAKLERESR